MSNTTPTNGYPHLQQPPYSPYPHPHPPKVDAWTGAHTMSLIVGIPLALLAPIFYGVFGALLSILVIVVLIVRPIQDKKIAEKQARGELAPNTKFWTPARWTLAALAFNMILWVSIFLSAGFLIAVVIYFIVAGVKHSNGKGN